MDFAVRLTCGQCFIAAGNVGRNVKNFVFFLMLVSWSASVSASAPDFNIVLLPVDKHAVESIDALATFSVFQTTGGKEKLLETFDSHIGDCRGCSSGIAFNCRFKDAAHAPSRAKLCRTFLKNGVGFRVLSAPGGLTVTVKNGTGMSLNRDPSGQNPLLTLGSVTNFVLTPVGTGEGSESVRLNIRVLTLDEVNSN